MFHPIIPAVTRQGVTGEISTGPGRSAVRPGPFRGAGNQRAASFRLLARRSNQSFFGPRWKGVKAWPLPEKNFPKNS